MADKQFLEWHGSQWRVRVKVPSELRAVFGKGKITVPLHTDSLAKANSLKWAEVAKIKANFAAAKKGLPIVGPLMVEATQLRLEQFTSPDNHALKVQARIAELADDPELLDFAEVANGLPVSLCSGCSLRLLIREVLHLYPP